MQVFLCLIRDLITFIRLRTRFELIPIYQDKKRPVFCYRKKHKKALIFECFFLLSFHFHFLFSARLIFFIVCFFVFAFFVCLCNILRFFLFIFFIFCFFEFAFFDSIINILRFLRHIIPNFLKKLTKDRFKRFSVFCILL